MPHKADKSFFDEKRDWSRKKDQILDHYLQPYLAKVARLKKPILIVDGFAGPGKYLDGEKGSPIIICERAREAIERGAEVRVLCIERDRELHEDLQGFLSEYPFAETIHGDFLDAIPRIEPFVTTHTVFLYVDPYAPSSLRWETLDRVFARVHAMGTSLEVLINFNIQTFLRIAFAELKREIPNELLTNGDEDSALDSGGSGDESLADRIVGGTWWRDIISSNQSFQSKIDSIRKRLVDGLRRRFRFPCAAPIYHHSNSSIPKYDLLFASRHPDALLLLNDEVVNAQDAPAIDVDLFAESSLEDLCFELASSRITRGDLILRILEVQFGVYHRKHIRKAVRNLIAQGRLESSKGRPRINDDDLVWPTQTD